MTVGILDSIDGALADYETSKDAMRWVPPGRKVTLHPCGPVLTSFEFNTDLLAEWSRNFIAGFCESTAALGRAMEPAVMSLRGLSASFVIYDETWPLRRSGSLAVNGREYQRRLRARRKRAKK